jgi:flagellar motor switch protein FliM
MSDQVLSQDEVDALLRGVTGEVSEDTVEVFDESDVRPYDIGRQERIVRGRMPGLELINERAARLMRQGFYNFMRRSAEISVGPVRVEKYSEFIRKLVVPTNINLIAMEDLYGTGLMVFDPNLVFQVVDTLFGGSGKIHMRVEGREFTITEQRVISRMLEIAFSAFDSAWQPVIETEHKFVRSEMNTQFVNIATPTEVVVVTTFAIELGNGGGSFHVCLPYSMIEPIREYLTSSMQGDRVAADERWLTMMREQVKDAEMPIKVDFCEFDMTFRQLMALEVGDMVPFEPPKRVSATIDGVPVFVGKVCSSRGYYAVEIERMSGEKLRGK